MAWKRSRRQRKLNGDDYISRLPEDVLLIILSKLKLTEAARASILSTTWRNLWTLLTDTLDIDASDFMSEDTLMECKSFWRRNSMFSKTVDHILWQHRSPTIDKLKIRSPSAVYETFLDHCKVSKECVDSWIGIAIKKQVKHLELDFKAIDICTDSSTKKRRSRSPAPFQPLGSTGFGSLVSLRLMDIQISTQLIHCFLSSSPLLEELSIVKAGWELDCLRICGPSLKLKRLDLISNEIKVLVISAPNLITFNYQSMISMTDLHLKDTPLLTRVSYSEEHMVGTRDDYPFLVPQLEELALTLPGYWLLSRDIQYFPAMKNLKQIKLSLGLDTKAGLDFLFRLMEASPSLCRLSLDFGLNECPTLKPEFKGETPRHECLKVVEVVPHSLSDNEIELIKRIAKYALSLEKIIIHCSPCTHLNPDIQNNDKEKIQELQWSLPQLEFEIRN